MAYIKDSKKDLISRVRKAKVFLKHHNIKDAKTTFFDKVYGSMYKGESLRIDNLWACKTTEVKFTELLEGFCLKPTSGVAHTAEFDRFMKFADWYVVLGGESLTTEQIEECYPKFIKKPKKRKI